MKYTLPVRPFLTSRVISALANSTSARTSVDTWAVASLTRSPMDGSALGACGSTSGIEVTVVGTPSLRSLTEHFLPASGVSRVHVATWRPRIRSRPTLNSPGWMVRRHVDGGWRLEDQRPLPEDFRGDRALVRALVAS